MNHGASAARLFGPVWAILWRGLTFFIAWGAIAALPVVIGQTLWPERWDMSSSMFRLIMDSVVGASLLAATWIMVRFVGKQTLGAAGLAPARLPRDFGTGAAIGIVWLAIPLGFAWVAGWIVPNYHGQFPWSDMPVAGLAVLVNVLVQQLLLTGYLFAMIRARAGLLAALAVSAVLFCAYHAPAFQGEWLPALNVFITANLFCLAREISGAIWLPIGMHAAWNFLLGPALGLTVSGTDELATGWRAFALDGPAWATGGDFGLEGSVLVTVTTTLLVAAILGCV
jgi:membrane protease YdiL (CAAX protease family)